MIDILEHAALLLEKLRSARPLVHHITNYVTVNDCANMTLAVGGSPVMADAVEEAAEIAGISSALVINMGTPNARTVESMLAAGRAANIRGIPVIFDPVGAGASAYRNDTAAKIAGCVRCAVIRGNVSEIRHLAGEDASTRGVDASVADTSRDGDSVVRIALKTAGIYRSVVAVTGASDFLTDGERVFRVDNGHPALGSITGSGCMCTSIIGAFCGAGDAPLADAISGVLAMGIAGEMAFAASGAFGLGSFRAALFDAAGKLSGDMIRSKGRVEEITP